MYGDGVDNRLISQGDIMEGRNMTIDIEELRKDLKKECYGAFFGGGFGGALMESFDVERATPEELIKKAMDYRLDLRKYEVD